MPKRKANHPPLLARHAKRRSLGPLRNLRISSLALRRYQEHASYFFYWINALGANACLSSEQELDVWIQEYVEQLWDHNAGLEAAQATLAGVQHFLKNTVRLKGAWKLLSVWRRHEPPSRAAPMPEHIVLALAMQALQAGDAPFCASLLLGFYGFLRTGEIISLTCAQCIFDASDHLVLYLGQCKAGKRKGEEEYAIIDHPAVCSLLRIFLAGRHPLQAVCQCDEFGWRRKFDFHLQNLGLVALSFRPYSLRRGGATCALRRGQTPAIICTRGRWANERTARMYIQEAVSLLQKLTVTPEVHASLIALATLWGFNFLR